MQAIRPSSSHSPSGSPTAPAPASEPAPARATVPTPTSAPAPTSLLSPSRPPRIPLSTSIPSAPPSTPTSTMRRARTSSRTRAPTKAARERLFARVMEAARLKRHKTVDERRAARVLERRLAISGADSYDAVSLTSSMLSALIAEIDADAREAEQAQLEQLERARDESDLEELLAFQHLSLKDTFVPCPACTDGALILQSSVLTCKCGLRVNLGCGEGYTLANVRESLAQTFEKHAQCTAKLIFRAENPADKLPFLGVELPHQHRQQQQQFLMASCASCGCEDIVV